MSIPQQPWCWSGGLIMRVRVRTSGVLAWLGLKAPALAWPEAALACSNPRPGQSCQPGLGPGLAWPRPRLFCVKVFDNETVKIEQILSILQCSLTKNDIHLHTPQPCDGERSFIARSHLLRAQGSHVTSIEYTTCNNLHTRLELV
jgi:hypothetical protein